MIDQIKKLAHAIPFQKFTIELSSGTLLPVPTPDHIAFSDIGPGRAAILEDDGTFAIVSGLHVVKVRA